MITLEESYANCKALNRKFGQSYYYSTVLLPPIKRPHVHALYAFCRYADDILDDLGPVPTDVREKALKEFGDQFFEDVQSGASTHPILKAVVHTVRAFDIPTEYFERFLRSMAMDLTVSTYESWEDLLVYMDGSAAVIGEMMLPILEPLTDDALAPARALGNAFQLSNFLRDINEDLTRNRIYLPMQDIKRFNAEGAFAHRVCTPEFVNLMRFEIERNRELYVEAARGIAMLPPREGRCIEGALRLYGGILDQIEAAKYDVFTGRVQVRTYKKLLTAAEVVAPPDWSAKARAFWSASRSRGARS